MNLDAIILAELQRGGPPLWVSGRTYPKGWEVRSPTNLQRYVRKVPGAGATDPNADADNWEPWSKTVDATLATLTTSIANVKAVVDAISAAPRGIKSIQRGVTTPGATGVVSVTISPVNTAKTRVTLLTSRSNNYSNNFMTTSQVRLASATSVEVTGFTVTDSAPQLHAVAWEVIEEY
ncbi:MAG: hypothetical protein Q8N13_15540 [Acidovorax sp.]|nr:hypothetical protein [Acidovorax sp.]